MYPLNQIVWKLFTWSDFHWCHTVWKNHLHNGCLISWSTEVWVIIMWLLFQLLNFWVTAIDAWNNTCGEGAWYGMLGYRGIDNCDAFIWVTKIGLKELGICHYFVFRMWLRAILGFLFSYILVNIAQNDLRSFLITWLKMRRLDGIQSSLPCFYVCLF